MNTEMEKQETEKNIFPLKEELLLSQTSSGELYLILSTDNKVSINIHRKSHSILIPLEILNGIDGISFIDDETSITINDKSADIKNTYKNLLKKVQSITDTSK
jgi:hypothetical protein